MLARVTVEERIVAEDDEKRLPPLQYNDPFMVQFSKKQERRDAGMFVYIPPPSTRNPSRKQSTKMHSSTITSPVSAVTDKAPPRMMSGALPLAWHPLKMQVVNI